MEDYVKKYIEVLRVKVFQESQKRDVHGLPQKQKMAHQAKVDTYNEVKLQLMDFVDMCKAKAEEEAKVEAEEEAKVEAEEEARVKRGRKPKTS